MTQMLTQEQNVESTVAPPNPIKVVIVDDSKLIRRAVRGLLESEPDIAVVGEAENGAQALDLVSRLKPDVITLDVNMPVMDGISTIKHLMIKSPLPTVMLSTLTDEGAKVTFDALRFGATDFMLKPSRLGSDDVSGQQNEIVQRVKNAANVSIGSIRYVRVPKNDQRRTMQSPYPCENVIALGTSEGGYGPLLNIIPALDPAKPTAYIIIFYTGERYLDAFAKYLSDFSAVRIARAENGMQLEGGTCYLLSGDQYATLSRQNDASALCIHPNPFPGRRGSVNMLMFSLAETFKEKSAGIVLSGLGKDGSEGLREIKRNGGEILVQDPATCLHKEMPQGAIQSCQVEKTVSDLQIANKINTSVFN
jgi:two-component system chemotaxis response regulator CheB